METTRAPAAGSIGMVTQYGYADGVILLRFTPRGEELAAPLVDRPPSRLVFGVPALDRLHTKYRATTLTLQEEDTRTYRLRLSPDANVLRAAEEYGAHPLVLWAEPSYLYRIPTPPSAPEAVRTEVRPRSR